MDSDVRKYAALANAMLDVPPLLPLHLGKAWVLKQATKTTADGSNLPRNSNVPRLASMVRHLLIREGM